jgi:hypothetical protein
MKSKICSTLFFSLIFLFICYFFIKIHPLYVFDTDDWAYIQDSRNGKTWIVWKAWNPTRVFPEIFMPAISWLSVIFIYPFSSDYIATLSVGFGVTLSFFVIILGIMFAKFSETKFKVIKFESLLFSLFFILFFFYPLYRQGNLYLLRSANVTCVFYYIIPALLNAIVVLWMLSIENTKFREMNYLAQSLLIVAIYFSLNSNLFQSVILVSYVSSCVLISFYDERKKREYHSKHFTFNILKNFFKTNLLYIFIIIGYLVILFFEANGRRASGYHNGLTELNVKLSFEVVIQSIKKLHIVFYCLIATNLIALLVYFYKKRKNKLQISDRLFINVFIKLVISLSITVLFLVLLCTKTGTWYLSRNDVGISYIFFILFISFCSIMYLYSCCMKCLNLNLIYLLPLFSIFLLGKVVFSDIRYAETTTADFPIDIAKKISDDLVSQIVSADKSGKKEIEIMIPKFSTADNWPLALYGAQRLSNALYTHRIIRNQIHVKFIPDSSINQKYNIE